MEILTNFGITWIQLIEYTVNFLLLLIILRVFAYKPFFKMLDKRRSIIEKSMQEAIEIRKQKEEIKKEYKKVLNEANKEANEIINKAALTGKELSDKIANEAKIQADMILKKAREEISLETDNMYNNLKKEISSLVKTVLVSALKNTLSEEDQIKILNNALKEIKE